MPPRNYCVCERATVASHIKTLERVQCAVHEAKGPSELSKPAITAIMIAALNKTCLGSQHGVPNV